MNAPEGGAAPEESVAAAATSAGVPASAVALNGATLRLGAGLALPAFVPRMAPAASPLTLPPLSYGFIALPDARAPACLQP